MAATVDPLAILRRLSKTTSGTYNIFNRWRLYNCVPDKVVLYVGFAPDHTSHARRNLFADDADVTWKTMSTHSGVAQVYFDLSKRAVTTRWNYLVHLVATINDQSYVEKISDNFSHF